MRESMKPGAARFTTPEEQRIRDIKVVEARLTGMTKKDIAQQMGVSEDTIRRSLKRAANEGLIQDAENTVVKDLVPLAIKVYREKLEKDKDPFVAKHVIDQLSKMAERVEQRQKHVEEMSLDAYFKLRNDKTATQGSIAESVDRSALPDITITEITTESGESDVPDRTGSE